jgi:KUP system potassium uptake protein
VISGAFSLTRQAVQLGYCPRLTILHTSPHQIGQVYLPVVNAFLFVGTVALVLGFGRSDHLAGAYGVAVSSTMLITTVMIAGLLRACWRWGWPATIAVCLPFFFLDSLFFGANALKILEGGWVSLSVAAAIFLLTRCWSKGRQLLGKVFTEETLPVELFLNSLPIEKPLRVPGTAVFLTGNPNGVPRTLLHNFKHNRVIHERVLLIKVQTEEVPFVDAEDRVAVEELKHGFYRVRFRYGFSEDPDVPNALSTIVLDGQALDPLAITFFLGRETLLVGDRPGMSRWRKHIFVFLSRNARDAAKFFRIPPSRVIELGIQVEI